MVSQFGGYNHRVNIAENQFYDMKNMSTKDFPLISTRNKRGIVSDVVLKNSQALVSKDNLIYAFVGEGDIGVTIAEDVPERLWVDVASPEETPETERTPLYTKIADINDNDAIRNILATNNNLSSFQRYIRKVDGKSVTSSGKSPILMEQNGVTSLYIEYEHEAVSKGTFWAKSVFSASYVYLRDDTWIGDGDTLIVATNQTAQFSTEAKRNALLGKTLYINHQEAVKIVSIEESGWSKTYKQYFTKGKFTIGLKRTSGSTQPEMSTGDDAFIRLTEPISEELPAGKYNVTENEGGEDVAVNEPSVVEVNAVSDTHVKVLKGKTLTIGGNEFNVSNVRIENGKRYLIIDLPHKAIAKGSTIDGDRLFLREINPITGKSVTSDIFAASPGKHTIIEMGANIVVFPEKLVVNTTKKNVEGNFIDIQPLEMTDVLSGAKMRLTDASGNAFKPTESNVGNTAPEEPTNGWAWIDTSDKTPLLRVYSSQIEQWAKIQPYCEITPSEGAANGFGEEWEVGDAVELEFEEDGIVGSKIIPADEQKYFVISAVKNMDGEKCIRFPVSMSVVEAVTAQSLTIKRTVPDMDFVIENENRLWGCKYGEVDGEMINEIFACKLGDPKNWHYFANTSIDSYYVSLGADGEFTGAYTYQGSPFFFRESCIHRIYGNYPANYALKTISCHGLEKGSSKGICTMNEVVYYKSPTGIMAFTGANPVCISETFGTEKYSEAVAGAIGNKMYFSMANSQGGYELFVFDDVTKLWCKEDDFRCKDMVAYGSELYALSEENNLVAMGGAVGDLETDFEWFVESCNFGYTTPFFKRLIKADVRLQMDRGSRASLYVQYDSSGDWQHITDVNPKGDVKSVSVAVQPHRCDHFKLMIKGRGGCKILSISKYIEEGSDNE